MNDQSNEPAQSERRVQPGNQEGRRDSQREGQQESQQDGRQEGQPEDHDAFDRHRRRVLWALPTGLYLIGSRAGEKVNLMTASLVVQVCIEPKLLAAAIETESVTADLVGRSGSYSLSLLARDGRDVVRRFVKPVSEVDRAEDGTLVALSGKPVREVGPLGLPILAAAPGYIVVTVTTRIDLGSHVLFIGEVSEVGGDPAHVLRTEDTRMHYGG